VPVPRRFDRRPPERDSTRINERIRVPKVRLIGADGEQVGIVDTDEARQLARDADLDLVEVAAGAKPPVARLLDYSKYKYEQEQKQKAARKHQTQVNIREIKLRPKIADNDYNTKKGHVTRFLKQGDKVKITIMFRGREQAHPERGRDLLNRLYEDLDGLATIESKPLQEGRNMSMLLGPSKEALQAAQEARKDGDSGSAGKDEAPEVPDHPQAVSPDAVPDHPQAVAPDATPDHPQAVPSTPEDLAEAAESAKADVSEA
jgi:translation initiation factor IF-3